MRYSWVVLCFALLPGCSVAKTRGAASADTLHVETATGSLTLDSDGAEDEPPRVLFRCEEGGVGAYLVTGSLDSVPTQNQMVKINLDSPLDC